MTYMGDYEIKLPIVGKKIVYVLGAFTVGILLWMSNGLRICFLNFTYFVCLDLYCGAYF